MEEVHFGGPMEVGIRGSLEMEYRVVMEHYLEMEDIKNMKGIGIMGCSMEKAFNSLKMVKSMKEHLKRTSSMEMEYSTKMIRLSMESGRIINYQWLIW